MSQKTPAAPEAPQQEQPIAFFMFTTKVVYMGDDRPKERTINILFEKDDAVYITRRDLGTINRESIRRVHAENNVDPKKVMDVIFLAKVDLGIMTRSQFEAAEIAPEGAPVN